MADNKNIVPYKVITEFHTVEPKWTGRYYYYPTKDWIGMEGTVCTIADSDEWLQKFKFGIPIRLMTQEEYKTWTINYVPHKWRGLFTAMKQGYVLLDFRTEKIFPIETHSLIKSYKRPKIHDGYIIYPIDANNRLDPPKIKLTVYKIETK
uniref:Uncharacterized protein n=1 Tax=Marseillevirus LCMAC101 TaxID=2506602 RepID=A0A481YTD1_9VIRU|nr:MAG: hypothetical protein LCMAC101_06300 [Marseillevirus LCMAC101]